MGIVLAAVNDETFVVETLWGRQVFKALAYCFGVEDGAMVLFVESTAACATNRMITLVGDVCDVWCE